MPLVDVLLSQAVLFSGVGHRNVCGPVRQRSDHYGPMVRAILLLFVSLGSFAV